MHVEGADPFEWRLSAATIASDGPFSAFPGIDRILVLLRGDGVRLDFGDDGPATVLDHPGAVCEFAGDRPVGATLVGGPTVDLNLMWRRDRYTAAVCPDPAVSRADITVVHVAAGSAVVHDASTSLSVQLGAGDSAWWERSAGVGAVADPASMLICFAMTRR